MKKNSTLPQPKRFNQKQEDRSRRQPKEVLLQMKKGKIIKVSRRYIVSGKELRELYNIKGEITHVGLWSGRSPNEIAHGVDPDTDTFEIVTKELKTQKE